MSCKKQEEISLVQVMTKIKALVGLKTSTKHTTKQFLGRQKYCEAFFGKPWRDCLNLHALDSHMDVLHGHCF